AIKEEKPDAVIIAGDLYDRAVPPTEAVHLLDQVLDEIVLDLKTRVLAIAGNHDSPGRLNFGSKMMRENGYYITGELTEEIEQVVPGDDDGEVDFHLVAYTDQSTVRNVVDDEDIRTDHEAAVKIVRQIEGNLGEVARHVYIGDAFVTPFGEQEENTSDS